MNTLEFVFCSFQPRNSLVEKFYCMFHRSMEQQESKPGSGNSVTSNAGVSLGRGRTRLQAKRSILENRHSQSSCRETR